MGRSARAARPPAIAVALHSRPIRAGQSAAVAGCGLWGAWLSKHCVGDNAARVDGRHASAKDVGNGCCFVVLPKSGANCRAHCLIHLAADNASNIVFHCAVRRITERHSSVHVVDRIGHSTE